MRIVHASDWHGRLRRRLPEADLYVFTGDMLPNFGGPISAEVERIYQETWAADMAKLGWLEFVLGSPAAPILCVRGNHDFVDLAPLFAEGNLVKEFDFCELIDVPGLGLRAAGMRGIPRIAGTWADEYDRDVLLDRARELGKADLYLTHCPPAGILDEAYGESLGLEGLSREIMSSGTGRPTVHMFGHIHECGGRVERFVHYDDREYVYSNAATTFNVIEI